MSLIGLFSLVTIVLIGIAPFIVLLRIDIATLDSQKQFRIESTSNQSVQDSYKLAEEICYDRVPKWWMVDVNKAVKDCTFKVIETRRNNT